MTLFLVSVCLLVGSGAAALLAGRSPKAATFLGAGGAIVACLLGLVPAVRGLSGAVASLRAPWSVPGGSFFVEIDALSAFFLLPIFALSALAALYGGEYLLSYRDRKSLGPPWFFFNLLVAGMALTVVARNAVLFLAAWEVMAVASYFLVTFEHEERSVREAGWTYLVAAHLGTAFLLALFLLLGRGSLDFDAFAAGPAPGALFLLAVAGFGAKAGFVPFHVWLPEAHPAAPSHVSALMSGVMIKTGIYGLARILLHLGPPPAWWGWTLVGIGIVSGILGVLFALAQHDLKRLLAYHSVENIGIIALGMGFGLLGVSAGSPALAVLGFGGGLLHVLNHAIFKGLLFLGAGAVAHGTGTREIDHLGGVLRRMPVTGATFLVGAAAISGLPPFNGFVSEFLIYLGAFQGGSAAAVATIAGLALIGGLAAACFAKAFGIVFLGEPRSRHAVGAREAGAAMRLPMVLLALACLGVGLLGSLVVRAMGPLLAEVSGFSPDRISGPLDAAGASLERVAIGAAVLLALAAALAILRHLLLSRRPVREAGTWDCGYLRPTARMQYTSSSFAQPLLDFFGVFLRTRKKIVAPRGPFPGEGSFLTQTPDVFHRGFYRPAFLGLARGLHWLRWLQHGRVHLYVLYIALTLVVLLLWKLG